MEGNLISGNFSRFQGGGIQHRGYCPGNNIIRNNRILFNENFFGAILAQAGDGGGIHIGGDVAGGIGAGNVTILGCLLTTGMMAAYYAIVTWVPTYLKTVRGLTVLNTGGYSVVIV